MRLRREAYGLRPDVQFPDSRFFNARALLRLEWEDRVLLCVLASGVPCIPRVRRRQELVPSV